MKIQTKMLIAFCSSIVLMLVLATYFIIFADATTRNLQEFSEMEFVVQSGNEQVQDSLNSQIQQASVGKQTATLLVVAVILISVLISLVFTNYVTSRINKLTAISNKLSKGEIKGLSVDVSGDDEIGHLGESLKGVLAAFNELNDTIKKK